MTQVCDFSSPQNLQVVRQHFSGIVRYVSDDAAKNITKAEFDEALSLSLTVTLVCEQGAQPAMRGVPGGSHDWQIANQQADAVGYDPEATIYYVAEDPSRLPGADWATVEEYFRALQGRPRGAYGGLQLVTRLMTLGLATKGWVVSSWGGTSPLVHLEQLVGGPTFGLSIDVDNVLQADYGQHPRPNSPIPPVPPSPEENDTVFVKVLNEGTPESQTHVYAVVNGIPCHWWQMTGGQPNFDWHPERLPMPPA